MRCVCVGPHQAIITKDEGGHDAPVHCLQTAGNFVFSADRLGCLKVRQVKQAAFAKHSSATCPVCVYADVVRAVLFRCGI